MKPVDIVHLHCMREAKWESGRYSVFFTLHWRDNAGAAEIVQFLH